MPDFYYATYLLLAFKNTYNELYNKYEAKVKEMTLDEVLNDLNYLQSCESSAVSLGLITTIKNDS